MKRPAVFLDRDGVLNEAVVRDGMPYPPAALEDIIFLPGVERAVKGLRDAGFLLVCVTNQPDVSRGSMPLALARAMNERVAGSLSLDGLYACFHDDGDGCDCRKPKPGLLLRAAAELDIDLGASSMVGDRWKDVAAGASAGCETFFIDRGYSEPRPSRCDHVVASLGEAADILIEGIREEKRK